MIPTIFKNAKIKRRTNPKHISALEAKKEGKNMYMKNYTKLLFIHIYATELE